MLKPNLPGIADEEGKRFSQGLPLVVDSHVHIFPENIFSSIWAWFDENAWGRELKRLRNSGLSLENLEWISGKSAADFFRLGSIHSID